MQYYITELFNEDHMQTNESDLGPLLARTGCGLELISFSIAEKLDYFENTLAEIKEMLTRLGDPPLTIHGPFLDLNPMAFDRLVQQATFDRFAQAYEAAERLGAKKVIFHSGMIPTVYFLYGWAERMTDFWKRFLESRSGITVCMENVLDREFEPFAEVADAVEHPDFGICLDLGHANCYSGHSPAEWAEALAPYLRHIHVHDNDGSRDMHLPCGRGSIPIPEILNYLLSPEPDGTRKAPRLDSMTLEAMSAADAEESFRALSPIY